MEIVLFIITLFTSCMTHPINKTNQNDHSDNTKSEEGRTVLYSFSEQGKGTWSVQNDVVMGGRSESQLEMTEDNHAHFSGRVSLENNGGFCSIQQTTDIEPYIIEEKCVAFVLLVKGDGKDYNFRVRTANGRHSYGFTFSTQNDNKWERISIPFSAMTATFRGRQIDVPNYAGEDIVQIRFLIGNKKEENFEILLESIEVI